MSLDVSLEERLLSDNIIKAVEEGDITSLKQFKETGEKFDLVDDEGNTILHLAVINTKERMSHEKTDRKFNKSHTSDEVFDYLLSLPEIDKNKKNDRENSVLMDVFMYLPDSPEWAVKLIDAGCEINERFCDDNFALHWAMYNDWFEIAELLIEKGVDIDCENCSYETPLHLATKLGLYDEIWLLLFYGADPNLASKVDGNWLTCFDLASSPCMKEEIQDIFLTDLKIDEKIFNLTTFVNVMVEEESNLELFSKIFKAATKLNYNEYNYEGNMHKFFENFSKFHPELLTIFIQKFDCVIIDMFNVYWWSCSFGVRSISTLQKFTRNFFLLFENKYLVEKVVHAFNSCSSFFELDPLQVFVEVFSCDENALDLLTQIIFLMLSYGVKLRSTTIYSIYMKLGYCNLFKMLLHFDVHISDDSHQQLVPFIFYFPISKPKQILRMIYKGYRYYKKNLHLIFKYFASPKLVEYVMDEHEEYMERMQGTVLADEFIDDDDNNEVLRKRVEKLPIVPSLVELARNEARQYIITKCKIKRNGKLYTIIDNLPIAEAHKKILTFETQLYY